MQNGYIADKKLFRRRLKDKSLGFVSTPWSDEEIDVAIKVMYQQEGRKPQAQGTKSHA